jgi:hypothetical protein
MVSAIVVKFGFLLENQKEFITDVSRTTMALIVQEVWEGKDGFLE